eukprot:764950-Hanusia_phi.AAC.1
MLQKEASDFHRQLTSSLTFHQLHRSSRTTKSSPWNALKTSTPPSTCIWKHGQKSLLPLHILTSSSASQSSAVHPHLRKLSSRMRLSCSFSLLSCSASTLRSHASASRSSSQSSRQTERPYSLVLQLLQLLTALLEVVQGGVVPVGMDGV